MNFDPKCIKFPYPIDTDKHYLIVKKDDGTIFDKNYPYVDKSKKFMRRRNFFKNLLPIIAYPICKIRTGLKINGKENLKKYKDVLDKGFVSISNHVHMWDYLMISCAVYPRMANVISWKNNISGENGWIIRTYGGIPVPTDDLKAFSKFSKSVINLLDDGGMVHICPEGSMWEFYQPIRPFKPGSSYFAIKANKPILPFVYTYRPCGKIRKLFGQVAKLTLNIGEPIYPRTDLPFKEAEEELTIRCHKIVCKMAGFNENENLYPPIFDNSKRIDYYTNEYGKGYKGSF